MMPGMPSPFDAAQPDFTQLAAQAQEDAQLEDEGAADVAEATEPIKPPKGFESIEARKAIAEKICTTIMAHDADIGDKVNDWAQIEAYYNDQDTPSSLEFLDDVTPYNFPLIQTRVDALVDNLCDGIGGADPIFVFGATDVPEEVRANVEKTVQYALTSAGFTRKIKDVALSAVLKTRGLMRVRYLDVPADNIHDEVDVRNLNLSPVQYSGLVIDCFRPEDSVVWPLFAEDAVHTSLIGHKFPQRLGDIQARQAAGEYFDDVEVPAGDETGQGVGGNSPFDDGKYCYDVIFRTRPEGGETDLRYRCTVAYTCRELLAMEEYRLPKPWYFAPGIRYEPNRFWGSRSIAQKMIQVQTVMNDAVTMAVIGSAAAAFPNVVTSGGMQEAQQIRMGIGNLIHVKQPVNMQSVGGNTFNAGAIPMLIELCERIADAIARISQAGMGQDFAPNTTATAAAGAMQGQARGISAVTDNFGDELVRMVDFARYLLAIKFDSFKAYHGDAVPCKSGADLVAHYSIGVNGSAGADPGTVVQKLELLIDAAQKLQVPLNPMEMFKAILNALELPVSTSQLLLQQAAALPGMGGANGQAGPNGIQPMVGAAGGQVPPGAPGGAPGGQPGGAFQGGPPGLPFGGGQAAG